MRVGHRVLVVDDEASAVETIRSILRRRDCYVEGAEDGRTAVERVRERHYDFVLMDIRMPELDGVAALREIRALPDPPPVALITAYSAPAVVEEARAAGAIEVLSKPADLAQVLALLAGTPARQSVLVVDPDAARALDTAAALRTQGRSVRIESCVESARRVRREHRTTDVVLLDGSLSGAAEPAVLAELRGPDGGTDVVLLDDATIADPPAGCQVLPRTVTPAALVALLDRLAARITAT